MMPSSKSRPCPYCEQCLPGAPRQGRCSKCGYEYDEHETSIRIRPPHRHLRIDVYTSLAVGLAVIICYLLDDLSMWLIVFLIVCVVWDSVSLFKHVRRHEEHSLKVYIGQDGLWFDIPEIQRSHVGWSDVARVECGLSTDTFSICDALGERVFEENNDMLGGYDIANTIAMEVSRLQPIYSDISTNHAEGS